MPFQFDSPQPYSCALGRWKSDPLIEAICASVEKPYVDSSSHVIIDTCEPKVGSKSAADLM